jgi:hypothetical protein
VADETVDSSSPKPATTKETSRKTKKAKSASKKAKRSGAAKSENAEGSARARTARIYPALSFEESLVLPEAIQTHASGERVARLTLLKAMNMSPTSSATQILITSSGKYGLTKGSYAAEHLELTAEGKTATDKGSSPKAKTQARFNLAVKKIRPFEILYERYRGKKLPSHDVMKDVLREANLQITDEKECIDTFIVNAKFLGLLQTIAGSETLMPLETVLEQLPGEPADASLKGVTFKVSDVKTGDVAVTTKSQVAWDKVCFYITPIGDEDSEQRKHSDLFLSSIVEQALSGFGLDVVRADKIAQPGMITSQVLEHILRARLVIADLSYHNPNVFYEMAIRHATRLPVVQICRKSDRLPFDVNQVRTITIDTSDIYTLVPRLETYRSEIATQVRAALDGQSTSNPISVFFPGFAVTLPK